MMDNASAIVTSLLWDLRFSIFVFFSVFSHGLCQFFLCFLSFLFNSCSVFIFLVLFSLLYFPFRFSFDTFLSFPIFSRFLYLIFSRFLFFFPLFFLGFSFSFLIFPRFLFFFRTFFSSINFPSLSLPFLHLTKIRKFLWEERIYLGY